MIKFADQTLLIFWVVFKYRTPLAPRSYTATTYKASQGLLNDFETLGKPT